MRSEGKNANARSEKRILTKSAREGSGGKAWMVGWGACLGCGPRGGGKEEGENRCVVRKKIEGCNKVEGLGDTCVCIQFYFKNKICEILFLFSFGFVTTGRDDYQRYGRFSVLREEASLTDQRDEKRSDEGRGIRTVNVSASNWS